MNRSMLLLTTLLLSSGSLRAETPAVLAGKAQAILKANCHRCHGHDGSLEGGMNFVLDREKLVARKKVVPGKPDESPLLKRVVAGKMPPEGQTPRPSKEEIALLKEWIEAGAPSAQPTTARPLVTETVVFEHILADLEKTDKRSRRFARYFNLAPLANAGAGPDELQSYRNALAKLLNSLSWHPRITLPKAIDSEGLVLRIDLRDFMWDANLWNRLLNEYPYGVLQDSSVGRAVMVGTATRMPVVRLDWFVANASRPPLYYDLLQIPSNLSQLEQQLRVDPAVNILQERVARAGFIGSGISKNNRLLERHDSVHGYYWRTYDFEAIPQNLGERDNLLPDRRNLFAYPLGPGLGENGFSHAGGEAIFSLPNGLQGYILVNANNTRLDKGPIAIVSDPKRPDRSVEAGVSCMNCHYSGILQKGDQIRAHVEKNPKAFNKATRELVRALYPPEKKTKALMDEDAERFRKALEKTGNKVSAAEVVMAMTLRHEADLDLAMLAAELAVKPDVLQARLKESAVLAKNFGALKVAGAAVARQTVVQGFGDLVRELRLGVVLQPGNTGTGLPDATGEVDPLEAQSSPANAAAISPDGKLAAFASADRSVRIWEVEGGRDLRRCIGHTASVWSVAFSADGTRLLSGSKDGTVRLWDVETGRELKNLEGHEDLVTGVAFSPNGLRALSVSFDQEAILWDLEKGVAIESFHGSGIGRYLNAVAFSPDGKRALLCADRNVVLLDAATGKVQHTLAGHTAAVVCAVFSTDGKRILSGSDDRTLRLWDADTGKELKALSGHENGVRSVAFTADGKRAVSGGGDTTVRLWDLEAYKELKAFRKHGESLVATGFISKDRQTLSISRDGVVHLWDVDRIAPVVKTTPDPETNPYLSGAELKPRTMIPVGGSVSTVQLSPDGKKLYYLNLTANKLGRIDVQGDRRDAVLSLPDGSETFGLSPDGKHLAVLAPGGKGKTRVEVFDALKMETLKTIIMDLECYDIALSDGTIYLSGSGADWTEIVSVDVASGKIVARWGGVWGRSFVQRSADGKRLYHASQGVTPGTLEALILPTRADEKPVTYRAATPNGNEVGGEFLLTPDGRYLLCKTGTVLRTGTSRENDLQFHATVGAFVAAAVDPERKAVFVVTREGQLKHYSYPEFKLQGTRKLGVAATAAMGVGKAGKLYLAGFDPRSVGDRPRARGHGDLFVYDLRDVMASVAKKSP